MIFKVAAWQSHLAFRDREITIFIWTHLINFKNESEMGPPFISMPLQKGEFMKIWVMKVFLIVLAVSSVVGCSKQVQVNDPGNDIHLPMIPTEITFREQIYAVIPVEVKEEQIGNEVGNTSEGGFKVFEIKGSKPEEIISLLVRDKNPAVYYIAIKKSKSE